MRLAVVPMGLMLVMSIVAISDTSFAARQESTNLEFEMSGCKNTMTCGAEFFVGDVVEFRGLVTTRSGNPISGAEITVYKFVPTPELIPIASGVTGIDGDLELTWTVAFTPTNRAPNDVTSQIRSETVKIYAQFEGDDQYSASRSSMNVGTINITELTTVINSDQNLYRQGGSALVFIAFVDSNDEFVDPDSLRVVLNDREIEVEKKKVGSYTVTLPALPKEHTQLLVVPTKEGYNVSPGFLTIIVDGLK